MGYTVDLQDTSLRCKSESDARHAAAIIEAHEEMCPYHLQVEPWQTSNPPRDDSWMLSVEHFQGDHWHDDEARKLWLALCPHMADEATIEFQGEDGSRWRIRWSQGRVFEEFPQETIWALEREVTLEGLKE